MCSHSRFPARRVFSSGGLVLNRISKVALILCVCFVSVTWGQQPAGTCSNNWTEFHRPNMQRWNPCEKVLNVRNVGKLSLKWSYSTNYFVFSSPAVADGVVYVGSEDGHVYALNARTGAPSCGGTLSAALWTLRPQSQMGCSMSARGTITFTPSA
jgi:hypothetical protein